MSAWVDRCQSIHRWSAFWPTYFHLLCAELELRAVDTQALPLTLREAQRRNLGRLRAYRRQGQFPRNTHSLNYSPCFVDQGGCRCAVAHLMDAAGYTEAVTDIARTANHRRLAQMDADLLEPWVATSGLTAKELARIQPAYEPDFALISSQVAQLTRTITYSGVIGLLTIIINSLRLSRHYIQRYTIITGVLVGLILLYLSWKAIGFNRTYFQYWPWSPIPDGISPGTVPPQVQLVQSLQSYAVGAIILGLTAIIVAVIRFRQQQRA